MSESESLHESVEKPPVESIEEGNYVPNAGMLHVAAVATHLERYMPLLVDSCRRLNVNLKVMGWGEKLTGFAFRLQKTLDWVETLPPNDVVLLIDAFDVILLQDAQVILKKFYSSGAQMILSKDGDHPNGVIDFFIKHVFRPVGNTRINIGGYIGYAGYIKDLMVALKQFGDGFSSKENDQELLARYLGQNKQLIGGEIIIDEHSDLFLTLYGGDRWWPGKNSYKLEQHANELQISDDRTIHYLPTDSWPCVVHFPANGNADELLQKLGYKLPTGVDKNYTQLNHTAYLMRMFKHYWHFLLGAFMKILLVVVAIIVLGYAFYCWRKRPTKNETQVAGGTYPVRVVPYQPWAPGTFVQTEIPRTLFLTPAQTIG